MSLKKCIDNTKKRKHEETILHYSDPPTLNQQHLEILIQYLRLSYETELIVSEVDSSFPKLYNSNNVLQPFEKWRSLLCIGKETPSHNPPHPNVMLRGTSKILLPEHRHSEAISQAHKGVKTFAGLYSRDKTRNIRHNKLERTLLLLRNRYAVGKNEFGIPLDTIMNFVTLCPECTAAQTEPERKESSTAQKIAKDRKEVNQMIKNFLFTTPQPPSMLWNQKKMTRQIWYGKKEMSTESNVYSKLLLVIKDMQYEIGKVLNKNNEATNALIKKLNVALQLVSLLKNKYPNGFIPSVEESEIMEFLNHLVTTVDVDTFLFDVQGLSTSCAFWEKVSLEKLTEMKKEIQRREELQKENQRSNSIDFNAPVTLTQYDISAMRLPDGSLGCLGHSLEKFSYIQDETSSRNEEETPSVHWKETCNFQTEAERFQQAQSASCLQVTAKSDGDTQMSAIGKCGQNHSTSTLALTNTPPSEELVDYQYHSIKNPGPLEKVVKEVLDSIIDQVESIPSTPSMNASKELMRIF